MAESIKVQSCNSRGCTSVILTGEKIANRALIILAVILISYLIVQLIIHKNRLSL